MNPSERETINANALEYPDGLTEKDKELIVAQCEHQSATSKEQIEGFAQAYKECKELALDVERLKRYSAQDFETLILQFAALIESTNTKGYRTVPVTFGMVRTALKPELIERAMQNFALLYAEQQYEPEEAYREFEQIHPFEDGNGRLGDLLWKMAVTRKEGTWPESLPPDLFAENEPISE